MALASVTNSLVQLATNFVGSAGLVGLFLLMLASSACIPIPSEVAMLFAGFDVSQGRFSLLAISIAGVAGNLVGDAHLAALALEHGATVVSFDRDFARFDGLRVLRPG